LRKHVGKISDFAGLFLDNETPIAEDCNAGRIITPVFEPTKAFKNDRNAISLSYITDNPTHNTPFDANDSSNERYSMV
jgi:hypothetical protein